MTPEERATAAYLALLEDHRGWTLWVDRAGNPVALRPPHSHRVIGRGRPWARLELTSSDPAAYIAATMREIRRP